VLAVNGDDGYPYALPINFYFDEENEKIYFHSGKVGHKLDAIASSDKVSFCVYDKGYHKDGHWSLNIRSVIIFGRIHIMEDKCYETDNDRYIANIGNACKYP